MGNYLISTYYYISLHYSWFIFVFKVWFSNRRAKWRRHQRMSNLKARRNALVDMEAENLRQIEKNSKNGTISNESTTLKSADGEKSAFHSMGAKSESHGSNYESSELSEEIVVTTDEEGSVASHKEYPSRSSVSAAASDYHATPNTADYCPASHSEKPPLPIRRIDNELNNNGLSNCNLLMNLPERDLRATIEQWQEVATLAALRYGSAGMDSDKLLLSVPTTLPLHQTPSSFARYDKNRIV